MNNNQKNSKIVVLGLSGGVDSAVSCYLLIKQGYHVIPIFMQNWDTIINNDVKGHSKKIPNGCESNVDYLIAKKIANFFHLKLYKINFIKQYWDKVFKYFINKYNKSLTPNPDVLCNKYIKFGEFKKYAVNNFKADYIATGHYAKIKKHKNRLFLSIPKDIKKDQTYFLANLKEFQLKNVIFPLANLTKTEVRKIAKKIKLPNWDRKDSTGICFIGQRDFRLFLNNYIPNKPGLIYDIETTKVIGKHIGTMYYTIGQNKGLNLSGKKYKYYVCKKDVKKNIIYVCNNQNLKKYLYSVKAELSYFSFINKTKQKNLKNIQVRFRHLQKKIKVISLELRKKKWFITYKPSLAVTPGQYAVIYKNNICLGCGEIKKIIK